MPLKNAHSLCPKKTCCEVTKFGTQNAGQCIWGLGKYARRDVPSLFLLPASASMLSPSSPAQAGVMGQQGDLHDPGNVACAFFGSPKTHFNQKTQISKWMHNEEEPSFLS